MGVERSATSLAGCTLCLASTLILASASTYEQRDEQQVLATAICLAFVRPYSCQALQLLTILSGMACRWLLPHGCMMTCTLLLAACDCSS